MNIASRMNKIESGIVNLDKMEYLIKIRDEQKAFKLFKDKQNKNLYYGYLKYYYNNGRLSGDNKEPMCYILKKDNDFYITVFTDWTTKEAKEEINKIIDTFTM